MKKAPVSEVFHSFQGEGLFAGQRNIFIRFYGCNLRCSYCDEVKKSYSNLTVDELWNKINRIYNKTKIRTISLTGGEPLIYSDFIAEFITGHKNKKFNYLLETNSTLVDEFLKIRNLIDIVSCDIKLPQYCGVELWDKHIKFLNLSVNKTVYVKVVFGTDVILKDFIKAVECVCRVDKKIPFFIQPLSSDIDKKNLLKKAEKIYELATDKLSDVRFFPQIHKIVGWR